LTDNAMDEAYISTHSVTRHCRRQISLLDRQVLDVRFALHLRLSDRHMVDLPIISFAGCLQRIPRDEECLIFIWHRSSI
jgi:hypothetical protein